MYFTGTVQAQNLYATLKQLITQQDTSLPTPVAYWNFIGSSDYDGVFQSTDGNNTLVRLTYAGIGLAMALGVYTSYTPNATQGQNGTFGQGDCGLIYTYLGAIAVSTNNYPPMPNNAVQGATGVPCANSNTNTIGMASPPTGTLTTCAPPTANITYYLTVRPGYIALGLSGDPTDANSLTQFGMAGRMNTFTNEVGNGPSFYFTTQFKGYGPIYAYEGSTSSAPTFGYIYVLQNKAGTYNTLSAFEFPTMPSAQPNVWDGNYYFYPVNLYNSATEGGFRGSIPDYGPIRKTNLSSGDEIVVGGTPNTTWKVLVEQLNTRPNLANSQTWCSPFYAASEPYIAFKEA